MDASTRGAVAARIDLAHEPAFALGPLTVEPAYRTVRCGGREHIAEPKVMQVLSALGREPGVVLSRDDLIETCWDGRIVGDASIDRVISLIRACLREMAKDLVTLETIPRVGYRIVIGKPRERETRRLFASLPRRISIRDLLILAACLLLAAGAAWWILKPPERPVSIAVMPFRSLSPDEGYFSAGLGQEIATQLAREPDLRVAGHRSTEMFIGYKSDPRTVGKALNVDYLLEGSVRRENDRFRVDVSLVDARDGLDAWSRSFDGELRSVLAMQRDIARGVLAGLHREVVNSGPEAAALSTSGQLYREFLAAKALLRERNRNSRQRASVLLADITRLDPGFAPAWAERAKAETMRYFFDPRWTAEKQAEADRRATGFANRAIRLAPKLSQGYAARALAQHNNGVAAIPDLQRAVELDPGNAEAWYWLGGALKADMRFAEALEAHRRVAALDPFWVRAEIVSTFLWDMGHRDEARRIDRNIVESAPDPALREAALARMAAWRGDCSGFIQHRGTAIDLTSNNEQRVIWGIGRNGKLARLGIPFKVPLVAFPSVLVLRDSLDGVPPPLEDILAAIDGAIGFWENPALPYVLPRMLLNTGRETELVQLYDLAFGSPRAMAAANRHGPAILIDFSPDVAIALRRAGRRDEADMLLGFAAARVEAARRSGPLPGSVEERAARIYAAQSRRAEAVASLKKAVALGWPNNHYEDLGPWILPPFASDPVYDSIASNRWVAALDRRVQGNLARERAEALRIR